MKVKNILSGEMLPDLIYAVMLAALIIYAVIFADTGTPGDADELRNFSGNWITQEGETADISDIRARAGKGSLSMTNVLPDRINGDISLYMVSYNAKFSVLIDGRERYAFDSAENFTGYGYGVKTHTVKLTPEDGGKNIEIVFASVFQMSGNGYMKEMYIGRPNVYLYQKAKDAALPTVLSAFIIFFGILFIGIWFLIPDRQILPYNIAALGIAAVILGIWCLDKTGFPQLFSEKTMVFRVLDYLAVFFAEYPVFCFVHSITQQKNKGYLHVFNGIWLMFLTAVVVLRFGLKADMHNIISLFYMSYATAILYMIYLLAEDAGYCRKHDVKRHNRQFTIGASIFTVCAFLEALSYWEGEKIPVAGGNFILAGSCCFIFEILMHFLSWWSGERAQKKPLA